MAYLNGSSTEHTLWVHSWVGVSIAVNICEPTNHKNYNLYQELFIWRSYKNPGLNDASVFNILPRVDYDCYGRAERRAVLSREMKFSGGFVEKFRSPGNEIFRLIYWKISFPGEQNFPVDSLRNFVPWGMKFSG